MVMGSGVAANGEEGRGVGTCRAGVHGHAEGTFPGGPCHCHASSRVGHPPLGHHGGHA